VPLSEKVNANMTLNTKTLTDSTAGLKFTESPRWHDNRLWFLDIHDQRIKTVDLSGSVETVIELPFIPNGFGLTPDGRTLLVGETIGHRLTAFDVADDGSLSNRRIWSQLPSSIGPDGICLDAEGGVWCANPEGQDSVVRVVEGGEITDRVAVDSNAYAVMLGGPERKHLFICASDSHDPAEIHRSPSASFRVVEVDIPGAGIP